MTQISTTPYWRLSGFYFCYFAALGALVPYWGLYLQHQGFSAADIGELMAIIMATKIVAPNVWGWLADRFGNRMGIIRVAALAAAITFAGVFFAGSFWWMAAVMAAFSFFWNAALPQFEATTMNHLGTDSHRYTVIRLWGSIGFIATVAGFGPLLANVGLQVLPALLLALFAGIWLASVIVPDSLAHKSTQTSERLREVLARPAVWSLLVVCFLMQASHGPYYTFFTIYLEQAGYTRGIVGQLWALGVVAEIGVFLVMHRWLPRFGARRLLLWSLALTTLRWLLIANFVQHPGVLILAQTLHAASFGMYHAVAIDLIHRLFTGAHQGRGQALYSSISFGAGGAIGSLMSGYIWTGISPAAAYVGAACISGVAWWVAYRGVRTGV